MQLSTDDRTLIVEKHFIEKSTNRKIAREMDCSVRTVERVLQRFADEHTLERHPRSGRHRSVDTATTKGLTKIIQKKPTATGPELQAELERTTGRRIGQRTLRLERGALNYHPVHPVVKPGL